MNSISKGHWAPVACPEPPFPAQSRAAFCETREWLWDPTSADCPLGYIGVNTARNMFRNKRVAFAGDSITRGVFHMFIKTLNPTNSENVTLDLKHQDTIHRAKSYNTTIYFFWAPLLSDLSPFFVHPEGSGSMAMSNISTSNITNPNRYGQFDLFVTGVAAWDALYNRDSGAYQRSLNDIVRRMHSRSSGAAAPVGPGFVNVWIQPTGILDGRLNTIEKKTHMTEAKIKGYREAYASSNMSSYINSRGTTLNSVAVSASRDAGSVDGVHYSEEVYTVLAQMAANAYALHFPAFYSKQTVVKQQPPKPTGSMSFPVYGAYVLALSAIMLFSLDAFLGMYSMYCTLYIVHLLSYLYALGCLECFINALLF